MAPKKRSGSPTSSSRGSKGSGQAGRAKPSGAKTSPIRIAHQYLDCQVESDLRIPMPDGTSSTASRWLWTNAALNSCRSR